MPARKAKQSASSKKATASKRVYHTNYFRQPEVLSFIADRLQIP